ncbi:MAG: glycerophosphodiester phosphodiesterase [Bryobacterales bacterium]|nr:glycerophosphodiester phosphodiesterase [Bryobacterales bacterium]
MSAVGWAAGPLVHGHRGARALRPENTLPAFEYAIAAGADVLELDLAVTKDDVLVVSHDTTINRTICQGPADLPRHIRELTLAQVRQFDCGSLRHPDYPRQEAVPGARIPTLDEVFALAGRGTFGFNVETKVSRERPELGPTPERYAELVLEGVRRHKLENRVILQSFDFRTLQAMDRLAPEIRLAALTPARRDFVAVARSANASIISPEHRLVTPERVREAQRARLQVIPWTANDPADWDRLIDARVDAIITDDPAGLIGHLRQRGLR